MVHQELEPGDVLSYSAGSTQTGPFGFRKLRGIGNLLDAAARRWPDLVEALGEGTILFINAYPAVCTFAAGITVDTYLSPRVLTRALQLGRVGDHPTLLLGQPLFVADAFLAHLAAGRTLPAALMLCAGGYVMPRSLERMLESLLTPHVETLLVVHYFGAAEVDGGCLMARERNARGELVYYPRDDVVVELDGDELLLSLLSPSGRPTSEPFRTGDRANRSGDGWVIHNPERLHPEVRDTLESWNDADWRRRTARG